LSDDLRAAVRSGLDRLGVDRLVLAVHDAAFPSAPEDDTGRGTPVSPAGEALFSWARDQGFDAVQLGPAGDVSPANPSPYDGTVFSRSRLSLSLARLVDDGWLERRVLEQAVAARPPGGSHRVPLDHVLRVHEACLERAFRRFRAAVADGRPEALELDRRERAFARAHAHWLEADALFEALRAEHPGRAVYDWGAPDRDLGPALRRGEAAAAARRRELEARHGERIARHRFVQCLAHEQHAALRAETSRLGVALFGDFQVGLSERDEWAHRDVLLRGYRMGAPPSRTNPEGQAWGYPLLDPGAVGPPGRPGPGLALFRARLEKLFDEFDGLRIDHPHGLVCPWVYRDDDPEPRRAVQHGARLFSAPDLPDHPDLARFAVAGRADLHPDPTTPRHADDWVVRLSPEQIDRYAVLFDALVETAHRAGRAVDDLACEVLSTLPAPLARVLERHGLGRFRVVEKADPLRPDDVYRPENAEPEDWIMVGSHDTRPLWALLQVWGHGERSLRARDAASRLAPRAELQEALAAHLERDPWLLAHALLADCLASRARHVVVPFTDLFGFDEPYNRPGEVHPDNWTLRLTAAWRRDYAERLAAGHALALPAALALALRARGLDTDAAGRALTRRLDAAAAGFRTGRPPA